MMRKMSKLAAVLFALHMFMLSGFCQSVSAAMLRTETIISVDCGQSPRGHLNNLLARAEIQTALMSFGINPQEARNRIDNLSDEEINKFVLEIDQLPAGGAWDPGTIALIIILLILVIVDLFYNEPAPDK